MKDGGRRKQFFWRLIKRNKKELVRINFEMKYKGVISLFIFIFIYVLVLALIILELNILDLRIKYCPFIFDIFLFNIIIHI